MRTLPSFLLVCLLGAASPVLAKTEDCVPDTGCPEGEEPLVDCCQEPKCEFWNALEEARATERVVKSWRFATEPEATSEVTEGNFEEFSKNVRDEIRKIRKEFPKCKLKGKRKNPPNFSLDPANKDCRIMTYLDIDGDKLFRELGLPEAKNMLDGCAEIIEAKFESANVGSTYCALEANSPSDRMKEREERATREKTVLEDQLIRYWRACTISPDFEPADIILKNSVDVLKRFNYNNKWTAPPARRAGK